jgi:hypothetical protein
MVRNRHALYLGMGLVLFFMASGFLGMCVGPDYKPATIQITSPAKGTVIEPGTPNIIISGIVKAGTSAVQTLKAQNKIIAFNSATGAFQYQFALDQTKIYSTCEFTVFDKNGISNIERVSYALGQSSDPGALGVIDDAMRIVLTDSLLNQVELFAGRFMNTWKNDLIYGWNNTALHASGNPASPFYGATPIIPTKKIPVPDGMNGWIQLSQAYSEPQDKGYANIGNISIDTNIQPNNSISASISISKESWVNPRVGGNAEALFVQGHYRPSPAGIEAFIHFTFYTDEVTVDNVNVSLSVNSSNKIVAKLDLTNSDFNLGNYHIEFGKISIDEDWLTNWIIDLVKDQVLSTLSMEMELVSIDDLSFDILGLNLSGWPMDNTIFTTPNADEMVVDLGLSVKIADETIPLNLTKFYSTLPNTQPDITMTPSENIALAVSDDLVNEASFSLIQLGILNGLDLSSTVKDLLGKLAVGKTIVVKATLATPPIVDFSGTHYPVLGDVVSDVGRFIVKDLYLELYYKGPLMTYTYAARMCVDVDLDLKLKLSDDGKHVQALLDVPQSSVKINYLYTNLTNAALLPEIGGKLAVQVVDMLLQQLINFDIPTIPIYGQGIAIGISDVELANNYLVAKVNVAVQ